MLPQFLSVATLPYEILNVSKLACCIFIEKPLWKVSYLSLSAIFLQTFERKVQPIQSRTKYPYLVGLNCSCI